MNNNPAKVYLQSYNLAKVRLRAVTMELADRYYDAARVGSAAMDADRVTSSPSGDGLMNATIRLIEVEDNLNRQRDMLQSLMRGVLETINSLSDDRYKTLLYMRYIRCMPWSMIRREMHYEERWCYEIHGRALAEVNLKIKKD